MAKKYTGSLSLDWFNKQKAILVQAEEAGAAHSDVPAPKMNWINKDESLFYEIVDEEGRGLSPYWVNRSDLRVKEARPLVFQKTYKSVERSKPGSLIDKEYKLVESNEDDPAIENMLIRGDNLLVLNALKKFFANRPDEEKVMCIYLDPPFNTDQAFEQYDDALEHSTWLTMLRNHLEQFHKILSNYGTIWVHLDDVEVHRARCVLDEVFGSNNFLGTVIWEKSDSPRMDADYFSFRHDYLIVYAKNKECVVFNRLPSETLPEHYDKVDEVGRPYYLKPLRAMGGQGDSRTARPNLYYSLEAPDGTLVFPKRQDGSDGAWRWSKEKAAQEANRIEWIRGRSGWTPYFRIYGDSETGRPPETIWKHEEVGSNRTSKAEVKSVLPEHTPFSTPKPEKLLQRIISISTNSGDLVIDSFGGSGTTGAVAHKMGRRWIMTEVGKHADTHIVPRLKKVLTGEDQYGISKAIGWQGGGSFKYYLLGNSVIDASTQDFNWKLGRDFIEKSLLSSYDFVPDLEFTLPQGELIESGQQPSIGFHRVGLKQMAGVISLVEPEKDRLITYDELMTWYNSLKKFKGTQSITVFTNRGLEIHSESKPDDLEVIKVPHAIFAELEK